MMTSAMKIVPATRCGVHTVGGGVAGRTTGAAGFGAGTGGVMGETTGPTGAASLERLCRDSSDDAIWAASMDDVHSSIT